MKLRCSPSGKSIATWSPATDTTTPSPYFGTFTRAPGSNEDRIGLGLGLAVELVVADLDILQHGRRRIQAVVAAAALLEALDLVAEVIEQQLPAAETADGIAHHLLQRFLVVLLLAAVDLGQRLEQAAFGSWAVTLYSPACGSGAAAWRPSAASGRPSNGGRPGRR
jgi:hypothetical protein